MNRVPDHSDKIAPPPLPELLARYLQRQAADEAEGFAPVPLLGEVTPYEAVPVQPLEPRLAWDEAAVALRYLSAESPKAAAAPPDWAALVASHEPTFALAFCAGNFPQLVRDLSPLWHPADLGGLRPAAGKPAPGLGLTEWAAQGVGKRQFPLAVLAVGTLRLARLYDEAAELLRANRDDVPGAWRDAWANEEAALAWHRGRADEAAALWRGQPASVPVLFNQGMAALFLGRPQAARAGLTRAVEQLPENSAWHHLGRLYLTLADGRA